MSEIIVGVDGTERGEDAVVFGRQLAAFAGARVVLVNVFPYEDIRGRATSLAYRETLHERPRRCSTRCATATGSRRRPARSPAHPRRVRCTSSPRGTARRWSWSAPRTSGRPGACCRAAPASACCTARRARSPSCPRATARPSTPRRGGSACGIDGHEEAMAALRGAAELARALGARGRGDPGVRARRGASRPEMLADLEIEARTHLDESRQGATARDHGGDDVRREDPADVLIERSHELDLLVIGSRGYGPLRAVLLGGVSGRVIRDAACPVIVVPAAPRCRSRRCSRADRRPPSRGRAPRVGLELMTECTPSEETEPAMFSSVMGSAV